MNAPVHVVVEGGGDAGVAERLLAHVALVPGPTILAGGKDQIDARLEAYNRAARALPWLIIRDLDSAPCAAALVERLLPKPERLTCMRIAVMDAPRGARCGGAGEEARFRAAGGRVAGIDLS